MRSEVTLALGQFGVERLTAAADRHRTTAPAVVRHAALYYLAEQGSDRMAVKLPRFARTADAGSVSVRLDLESGEWEALERLAARQDVDLGRLLAHAVQLFLADLESGRVATRVFDGARESVP